MRAAARLEMISRVVMYCVASTCRLKITTFRAIPVDISDSKVRNYDLKAQLERSICVVKA